MLGINTTRWMVIKTCFIKKAPKDIHENCDYVIYSFAYSMLR